TNPLLSTIPSIPTLNTPNQTPSYRPTRTFSYTFTSIFCAFIYLYVYSTPHQLPSHLDLIQIAPPTTEEPQPCSPGPPRQFRLGMQSPSRKGPVGSRSSSGSLLRISEKYS